MYARGSTLHIVLANLTTLDPNAKYDPACIVDVGDHPFVDRRSYIAYRFLRFESVPYTSDMVEQGQWTLDTPCSAALLARMTAGLCASKLVDRGVKYMFKCPGVIPPA